MVLSLCGVGLRMLWGRFGFGLAMVWGVGWGGVLARLSNFLARAGLGVGSEYHAQSQKVASVLAKLLVLVSRLGEPAVCVCSMRNASAIRDANIWTRVMGMVSALADLEHLGSLVLSHRR